MARASNQVRLKGVIPQIVNPDATSKLPPGRQLPLAQNTGRFYKKYNVTNGVYMTGYSMFYTGLETYFCFGVVGAMILVMYIAVKS